MDGDARLIAAAVANPVCLWCETGFEPRKGGGAPQRFCQPKCRDEFHSAGRRYAEYAVLSGRLAVAELRNASLAPCRVDTAPKRSSEYPGIGSDEIALSAAQRASARDTILGVPINAEGLIELCALGWLDPDKLRHRNAAAASSHKARSKR